MNDIELIRMALEKANMELVAFGANRTDYVRDAIKALSRVEDVMLPDEVIAARFIVGDGENQQIAYWDKNNIDDTAFSPRAAVLAAIEKIEP